MVPQLQSAEYVGGHVIHVKFADGTEADLDLQAELWGEVFEPLQDIEVFRRFRFDPELNTVTWPTGADLAPEFLYEQATQQAESADRPSAGR
jgi:hypothetical protein